MIINYVKANPSGNITLFVLNQIAPEDRKRVNEILLAKEKDAEQVACLSINGNQTTVQMMGGEFCGNATRSSAAYALSLSGEKSGDFQNAFLDFDMLDNPKYYNKYDAMLNGSYVETRIINKKVTSGKVLVIADSYGRSSCMYTALNYHETRYLDPQEGRYNDNYLDYIKEYMPETVIIMAPEEINVGNGNY